ncbi:hypothetical protein GGX14DRAFT_592787 [Mycena pura]|uniref:Uncharacterized protein n=1 Tax=Mycena pura TaxID=153505 RepID=A0AAD6VU06_9AGAR|nr:hypothetical protein GGX14DRAFT_592787 [Mycena pura]
MDRRSNLEKDVVTVFLTEEAVRSVWRESPDSGKGKGLASGCRRQLGVLKKVGNKSKPFGRSWGSSLHKRWRCAGAAFATGKVLKGEPLNAGVHLTGGSAREVSDDGSIGEVSDDDTEEGDDDAEEGDNIAIGKRLIGAGKGWEWTSMIPCRTSVASFPTSSVPVVRVQESQQETRERLRGERQKIIDDMLAATGSIRPIPLADLSPNEFYTRQKKNNELREKICAPFLKQLEDWENNLSIEDCAALDDTPEEEAYMWQRYLEVTADLKDC